MVIRKTEASRRTRMIDPRFLLVAVIRTTDVSPRNHSGDRFSNRTVNHESISLDRCVPGGSIEEC